MPTFRYLTAGKMLVVAGTPVKMAIDDACCCEPEPPDLCADGCADMPTSVTLSDMTGFYEDTGTPTCAFSGTDGFPDPPGCVFDPTDVTLYLFGDGVYPNGCTWILIEGATDITEAMCADEGFGTSGYAKITVKLTLDGCPDTPYWKLTCERECGGSIRAQFLATRSYDSGDANLGMLGSYTLQSGSYHYTSGSITVS